MKSTTFHDQNIRIFQQESIILKELPDFSKVVVELKYLRDEIRQAIDRDPDRGPNHGGNINQPDDSGGPSDLQLPIPGELRLPSTEPNKEDDLDEDMEI